MMKLLFLFVTLLFPFMANAEEFKAEIDGINYKLTLIPKGNVATAEVISKSSGYYAGDIAIPSSVNYKETIYDVTSVGSGAFRNCSNLTSISIPKSVTSLSEYAFSGCDKLLKVYISDLSAWFNYCFYHYYRETGHDIYEYTGFPQGYHLYLNNEEVENLIIPNNVTTINRYAFWGCSSIKSLTIPNNVTKIEESAS